GLLKQIDALLEPRWCSPIPRLPSFQVQTIGFRIRGSGAAHALSLVAAEADPQAAGYVAGDVSLHLRDVRQVAVVARSPDLGAIGSINQISFYRYAVTLLHDAAHEDTADLKSPSDFSRIILVAFETEDGAPCHDLEIWQLRKCADQTLGQAVAEVFIAGIGGGV